MGIWAFEAGELQQRLGFASTHDRNLVLNAVDEVSTKGNGRTALRDAVVTVAEQARACSVEGQRVVVVISDGYDEVSEIAPDAAVARVQGEGVQVFAIGLGPFSLGDTAQASQFMRDLSTGTGGDFHWHRPARTEAAEELDEFLNGAIQSGQQYILTHWTKLWSGSPVRRVDVELGGNLLWDERAVPVGPIPPSIQFRSPAESLYHGAVLVEVEPHHNQREIERVDYYLDESDEPFYTAWQPPYYSYEWDTQLICNPAGGETHYLKAIVTDNLGYSGDVIVTIGIQCPPPTPTPYAPPPITDTVMMIITTEPSRATPMPTPEPQIWPPDTATTISIAALGVALAAMILLIILLRRGTITKVAAEVRRRTKVLQQRTAIRRGGGAAIPDNLATLTVESEPMKGRSFFVNDPDIFLGREADRADVAIEWDDYLSGRHARLRQVGDQFFLWDLDSTNGTWVGGRRLVASLSEGADTAEAMQLNDGDLIRFGPDLILRFHMGTPKDTQRPPAIQPEAAQQTDSARDVGISTPTPAPTAPGTDQEEMPTAILDGRDQADVSPDDSASRNDPSVHQKGADAEPVDADDNTAVFRPRDKN